MAQINELTFKFLKELKDNNNRPWFQANKMSYQTAQENIKTFLTDLASEMGKTDDIETSKLFRIYRDVRFSKDKTPYKAYFSMFLSRRKPSLRGGYYLMVGPDNSHIGCGFWKPSSADLKLIRDHIAQDDKPLREIIAAKKFKATYGQLEGDAVKSAPKGFSKGHPAIDLIRHKQFIVSKKYTDEEVLSDDFLHQIIDDYGTIRPFFNYMSDILSHDLNGVPLY